jgi:protein-S-isoprenylcysteine O-methyltransferase Ste14
LALGIVLLAPGLAFTVWARVYLGRNWSGMVTLKQGEIFPGQYQSYCAEVPALVPFTKARRSAPR